MGCAGIRTATVCSPASAKEEMLLSGNNGKTMVSGPGQNLSAATWASELHNAKAFI